MTSLPPKIDQRTYEDIVQQTEKLAQQFTDWQPATQGKTDAGEALIRIFAKMVKSVSDRLNQVPEKNFLAFLDLIGGQLKPPLSAKVPLTFTLAAGSPTDGFVPAQTQVSAPAEGSDKEIVFETDGDLVVTTAQLQAVFVREPSQDMYSDCTLAATGEKNEAFLAFAGDLPIEHSLYLSFPEIFTLPELPEFKLTIITDNASLFESSSLHWSYWHGSQWKVYTPRPKSENGQLTFTNLPILTAAEIHGKTAQWLQAKFTNLSSDTASLPQVTGIQGSIDINKSNLIPEVCLFNSSPLDLSKDFYPFGEQPEFNDTFYIALNDSFIKPNTEITLKLIAKAVNPSDDLTITWEMGNSQEWQEITTENNGIVKWSSESPNFTKDINSKLQIQEKIPLPSTVNGETRYWIRARITQGHYGKVASERQYAVYDDSAVLTEKVNKDVKQIKVDSVDIFQKGDKIRLFPNTEGFPEEHQITAIDNNEKTLTLNEGILNTTLAVGTRVMRKSILTETIPPTYDPPLVKSLKLTYKFTITEKAIYLANNDYKYSHPEDGKDFRPFTPTVDKDPTLYLGFDNSFDNKPVTLYAQVEPPLPDEFSTEITETDHTEGVNVGQTTLNLNNITGWRQGDRIAIKSNDTKHDVYVITEINNSTITISPPSRETYNSPTTIIRPTTQPKLVWEYSGPQGWQPLGVQDETKAFSQRGLIKFIAPADFSQLETFGKKLYWLRVRWEAGNFRVKPRLRRILTNTIWAKQATTLTEEVLGSSNEELNQVFVANNSPILMGQRLEVQEGRTPQEFESDRVKVIRDDVGNIEAVWVLWQEVPNFYCSKATERHYTLDRQTGKIRFGDGLAGMIPPRGRNNIRLSYRTGGGKQGNITSPTINQLKTTIPYIDKVENLEAAAGGGEQETLDRLKKRVPKQLRHRDRAVTIEDFEDLAYEASTDVARVRVITPDLLVSEYSVVNPTFWYEPHQKQPKDYTWDKIKNQAGQVKLIILPDGKDCRQPVPSLALLEQVETYIRSRCEATVDLVVTAPKWQEVSVTATITPESLDGADIVRNQVKERLKRFLHPLSGSTGEGWEFGRYPPKSEFYAIIQSIAGVDHVDHLVVKPDPSQKLDADTLIYSGHHVVNLRK